MSHDRSLPPGAEKYSGTPVFTKETVPDALLKDHSTKKTTYGLLRVSAGTVKYYLSGQNQPLAIVEAGQSWVILPAEVHFVEISDDAMFEVEFHRDANTIKN